MRGLLQVPSCKAVKAVSYEADHTECKRLKPHSISAEFYECPVDRDADKLAMDFFRPGLRKRLSGKSKVLTRTCLR